MWESQQDKEKFRKEVEELRRLVWLDILAGVIGDELMPQVDEDKYFELIRSRHWVLMDLKRYLIENVVQVLKEDKDGE
ncbi:MAG: hypothetical protein IKY23_12490 [Lachnospiraceae bacterium]|nr:hypothetical protein [Lachnospiraceae bacterium]